MRRHVTRQLPRRYAMSEDVLRAGPGGGIRAPAATAILPLMSVDVAVAAVPRAPDRRAGARRRPGPRRRQRRQAVLARRRAARPLHRRGVRRPAIRAQPGARQPSRSSTQTPPTCRSPTAPSTTRSARTCSSTSPIPSAWRRELTRVARRGLHRGARGRQRKIVDFPSHLWWCRLDEDRPGRADAGDDREDRAVLRRARSTPTSSGPAYGGRSTTCSNSRFEHRVIQLPLVWIACGCAPRASWRPSSPRRRWLPRATSATWETVVVQLRHQRADRADPDASPRRASALQPGRQARAAPSGRPGARAPHLPCR